MRICHASRHRMAYASCTTLDTGRTTIKIAITSPLAVVGTRDSGSHLPRVGLSVSRANDV